MRFVLTRFKEIKGGTIGKLEGNGLALFTLEPAGPDTVERGQNKRIPEGLYKVTTHLNDKSKYYKCPLLYNEVVPKDRGILIHIGNTPVDSKGCILVGLGYNDLGVKTSKIAFQKLREVIKHDDFEIEIKNNITEFVEK